MAGTCGRETDARRAARSAAVDPELRAHAAGCEACRETMTVAAWMQEFAAAPLDAAPLPNPGYLWWKAQILREWERERAVAKPLEVGERVQVGIGLAGALLLLAWLWREVRPDAAAPVVLVLALSAVVVVVMAIVACLSFVRPTDAA